MMDAGAWIEKWSYPLDDGTVVTEPSAQIGVIHGKEAHAWRRTAPLRIFPWRSLSMWACLRTVVAWGCWRAIRFVPRLISASPWWHKKRSGCPAACGGGE